MFVLDYFTLSLSLIFSVAFITLLERKALGYMQLRKGPNKPSFKGVATPAADAFKLLLKESVVPRSASRVLFSVAPVLSLFLFLFLLVVLPSESLGMWGHLSLPLFLCVLSWNVYPLFFSGWASNSPYAFLGSARGISQTISYEISLAFLVVSLALVPVSLTLSSFTSNTLSGLTGLAIFPVLMLWFFSGVAETNRAPFDFAESESELVSGFNIEYGGAKFALIFLAEYGMILLLSAFMVMFSGLLNTSGLLGVVPVAIPVIVWVWVRATFPRYRYDKLMSVCWKSVLPLSLAFCSYYFMLMVLF